MSTRTDISFDSSGVRHWIDRELAAQRINGCALEVVFRGNLVLREDFGVKNKMGDPVSCDTRFWIASMTKPVVSVAALQLIERNVLSLNDPIKKYISGFGDAGVLTASGGVESVNHPPTILDLLTHMAGVTYGQFGNDEIHKRYAEKGVFNYESNNAEMGARLAKLPLLHQPGTVFEYGMSTDLLGRIVELVTDTTLDQALKDNVFDPLGMTKTSFIPDQEGAPAELASSIIQKTLAPDFDRAPTWYSGGAGLFSTVSDYSLFARMLLGQGKLQSTQILKPETCKFMFQQHLPPDVQYGDYTGALGISAPWVDNGLTFGLGVAVRIKESNNILGGLGEVSWPGVSGGNFWVDQKNDLTVVFLTHSPLYRTTHRIELRDAIYRGIKASKPEISE